MRIGEIKELIRYHNLGISPRRLGQHFLVDPHALERLAKEIQAGEADRVIEIGAGLGALTEALLRTQAMVYAVERDRRFSSVLADRFKGRENFILVRSDILKLDLASYALGEPQSLRVIGNIPYSLTSPILDFLIGQRQWIRRVVLTVQKEVADRIVARPGGRICSSITWMVQSAFKPTLVFTIPPGAFYPKPKVTSAVLRLEPWPTPRLPVEEEAGVLALVRSTLIHRRKTLLNALQATGRWTDRKAVLACLIQLGLDPQRRPETLNLEEFLTLHRGLRTLRMK